MQATGRRRQGPSVEGLRIRVAAGGKSSSGSSSGYGQGLLGSCMNAEVKE